MMIHFGCMASCRCLCSFWIWHVLLPEVLVHFKGFTICTPSIEFSKIDTVYLTMLIMRTTNSICSRGFILILVQSYACSPSSLKFEMFLR